jgi:hypothetical protein
LGVFTFFERSSVFNCSGGGTEHGRLRFLVLSNSISSLSIKSLSHEL